MKCSPVPVQNCAELSSFPTNQMTVNLTNYSAIGGYGSQYTGALSNNPLTTQGMDFQYEQAKN
jgi:hypothetical protein